MKRSEMLSKIASVIINYNKAHCIVDRDKAMEMAETILQIQEKLGMLPPEYVVDYSPMITANAWEQKMTEVLYCPINNELFLFTGCYEYYAQTNTLLMYLQT